jgi:hypothetical protein
MTGLPATLGASDENYRRLGVDRDSIERHHPGFWLCEPDRRVLSLIKHGHYRHLERLYAIKRYLNRQSFNYGKAERALGEALEGPIEY